MKKIGFIVGSLRKDSYNLKVAKSVENILPEGYEAEFIKIDDIPLYNEDLEDNLPATYVNLRKEIRALDGIIFFTPEYNRSIPGGLKNALDVASRPYGQNMWDKKPALIISSSIGNIAGFGANHALRQALVFLNVPVIAQPEIYLSSVQDLLEDDELKPDTLNFIKTGVDELVKLIEK